VVALGTDYNILMIARLREQAREGMNPRLVAGQREPQARGAE
jgi:RND superfamily putative drug exporter